MGFRQLILSLFIYSGYGSGAWIGTEGVLHRVWIGVWIEWRTRARSIPQRFDREPSVYRALFLIPRSSLCLPAHTHTNQTQTWSELGRCHVVKSRMGITRLAALCGCVAYSVSKFWITIPCSSPSAQVQGGPRKRRLTPMTCLRTKLRPLRT